MISNKILNDFRFYILECAILKPKCKIKYNYGNIVGNVPSCFVNGDKSYGHMGYCLCEFLGEDRCYKPKNVIKKYTLNNT